MPNNIKYSIEQQDGNIVARSTVTSFNLDHVTDKDITSYYRQISSQALFDTGLLPLNGTGVLAIRSAGRHTQIAFQHAPTLAYINWGKHEGDPTAKAYLLAQPYRIWIADLLDGNLYGARMFYSPYPISHPDQPLYHINLPNTNCKGYRGNGVGWQCLYHNEDWTKLSFNEKIDKLIQRCSGIEAYNDANMSETDGPRFYRENNKPEYLWNPVLWQEKSQAEGFDWTLDENLWIPILVKDIDNQDKHYDDGQPLTFAMALLGKYNAYYHDDIHPKLINAFARPDVDIPVDKVFEIFSQSHNSAKATPEKFDQFNTASLNKIKIAETFVQPSLFDQEEQDEDETFSCVSCEDTHSIHEDKFEDPEGDLWCQGCFEEYWIYCENSDSYLHCEDENCVYIEHESIYIDSSNAKLEDCPSCGKLNWLPKNSTQEFPFFVHQTEDEEITFCPYCFPSISKETFNIEDHPDNHLDHCFSCGYPVIKDIPQLSHLSVSVIEVSSNFWNEGPTYQKLTRFLCNECAKKHHYCPSGHWTTNQMVSCIPWVKSIKIEETDAFLKVNEVCTTCLNSSYDSEDEDSSPFRTPQLTNRAIYAAESSLFKTHSLTFELFNADGSYFIKEPF